MNNIKKYQIKTSGNNGILEVAIKGKAAGSDCEILLNEVSALVKEKNAGLEWEWFTDMNEARDFLSRKQQTNNINLYDK
ncbi:MAG: hypothetical protein WBN66_04085 [Smithella sp.]